MSELLNQLKEIKINEFFDFLLSNGWIQILFPFLLTYAIVFSVSRSISFMEDRKGVRVLVSVIISFFAVTFPVGDATTCDSPLQKSTSTTSFTNPMFNTQGCTLGDYMSLLFPGVTILSMMILGIYIIAQLVGVDLAKMFGDTNDKNKVVPFILIGIGALMIGYFTLQSLGFIEEDDNDSSSFDILKDPLLWTLIVFGLIFYFVGGDPKSEPENPPPATPNNGGSG